MLKYAILFLIISLVAGALGFTGLSGIARKISMVLFAIFFVLAALFFGFVYLVGEAIVN